MSVGLIGKQLKELTEDEARALIFNIKGEALDEAIWDGKLDALLGTEYEEAVVNCGNAIAELNSALENIKKDFDLV